MGDHPLQKIFSGFGQLDGWYDRSKVVAEDVLNPHLLVLKIEIGLFSVPHNLSFKEFSEVHPNEDFSS